MRPSESDIPAGRSPGLHRFAVITTALILLLIFFGGQVKSTNSGLSVPDWPNTYGHFMFTFPWEGMVGGIFWEHSHRMIASVVGLLTFILTIWVYRVDSRSWVRKLSLAASIAVLVQGVFGGLTVLLRLPAWTSSTHGTLAQIYFCMLIVLMLATSRAWRDDLPKVAEKKGKPLRTLALVTFGAIFLQLMIGAVMRHTESGLAIPDFPTMFGSWVPPLSDAAVADASNQLAREGLLGRMRLTELTLSQVLIHLTHRLWAVVVTVLVLWTGIRVLRSYGNLPQLRRPALWMIGLLVLQVTLGILTIYTEKQPTITTLHVTVGAMTLGAALILVTYARHLLGDPESVRESRLVHDSPYQSEPEHLPA